MLFKTNRNFCVALVALLLLSSAATAQLNGTYTINSAVATGGTNFQNFNDLATALTNQGINGNVTVNVVAGSGPYTERVTFTTITGSGPGAVVTINGNGNTITAATSTSDRHVIRLSSVSYFTINNLTVVPTASTTVLAVHVYFSGSNITINNVSVDMTGITSSTSAGIVASGSETSNLTAGNFSNITFSNNTVTGGGYGISFMGTNNSGLSIHNNNISNFSSNGIYTRGTNGAVIRNNSLAKTVGTAGAGACNAIQLAQSDNANASVHSNLITHEATAVGSFRGIYVFGGTGHKVYNNVIRDVRAETGSAVTGIRVRTASSNPEVYFNTIDFSHAPASTTAVSLTGIEEELSGTGVKLNNNIFHLTQPSSTTRTAIALGSSTVINAAVFSDNHVFWVPGGNLVTRGTTSYPTLASWQAAGSQDGNSLEANPYFQAGTAIPTSGVINNRAIAIAGITTDIVGAARSASPDPGAYEFTPAANDAAIIRFIAPPFPFCGETLNVQFELTNAGNDPLTSATIQWTINGGAQAPVNWTGSLAPGASAIVTLGTASITAGAVYQFSATVSDPNGLPDANPANNTSAYNGFRTGMSGDLTINGSAPASGTNYQTFQSLSNDLSLYGVCGQVNITVLNGPYTAQVLFDSIPGTSATNKVILNGNNQTLQFTPASGTDYILRLNRVDHLEVTGLTVKGLDANNGWAVHLTNNATNIVLRNNVIDLTAGNSSTLTSSMIGVLVSSTSSYLTGTLADNITITGNTIMGGYVGVQITGVGNSNKATNVTISQNTVQDYFMQGIQISWGDNIRILKNQISRPNRTNSGGDATGPAGININSGGTNYIIDKNRIFNIAGNMTGAANDKNHWGIKVAGTSVAPTSGSVTNNLIYHFNNNWSQYGIDFSGVSSRIDIFHNTIVLNQPTSTASGSGFQTAAIRLSNSSTQANVTIRNNILVNTRGGTGLEKNILRIDAAGTTPVSNHNVYYLSAPEGTAVFARRPSSTAYNTLADWRSATGQDNNSVTADPQFTDAAAGNYRPTNSAIDGQQIGTSTVGVADDILDIARAASPDPGAYEFTPGPLPIKLVKFRGEHQNGINRLYWTTSVEINSAGFELQRSVDGVNFTAISYVHSKAINGQSSAPLDYEYSDEASRHMVYYRLKLLDKDNRFTYSPIVRIHVGRNGTLTIGTVYPNPVKERTTLQISSSNRSIGMFQLIGTDGRIMHQEQHKLSVGNNTITLFTGGLPAGSYFLRITIDDFVDVQKVFKQ